jgi:asparagine N-glycosylation enzyme membrane subunit Stt3
MAVAIHNERVVHFSSLMETVEDELRNAPGSAYPENPAVDWANLNEMESALNDGSDHDYSPETWEQQLTLLSETGLLMKMKDYGVAETTIAGVRRKLEELGHPWIAPAL